MSAPLEAARSGMLLQQQNVDVIASNIANVNTVGYKRLAVHFLDVLTDTRDLLDPVDVPTNVADSAGIIIGAIDREMSQGSVQPGAYMTDLAIVGEGFFQVRRPDGAVAYTRDGSFRVDGEGRLVTASGYALEPEMRVPAGTAQITVSPEGVVSAYVGGVPEEIGTIETALFTNPAGLLSIGGNLFLPSENSGDPQVAAAGVDGHGIVAAGMLEQSNVEAAGEMTGLILAQRAYQMSLSAYQTASDMARQARELAGRG